MNAREKIIDRVRLLLNLGRSPNANEAESAVAMAARLMDDHRISEEEVGKAEHDICFFVIGPVRILREHREVINILLGYFNVKVLTKAIGRMRNISVYGEPADLEIARQVYNTLLAAFKQRWQECKARRKRADRYSFMRGIACGVMDRLDMQRQSRPTTERNALIVIEKNIEVAVDEFCKKEGISVAGVEKVKEQEIDRGTQWAGFVEGLAIDVYSPLQKTTLLINH
jgi:hypothetical protein